MPLVLMPNFSLNVLGSQLGLNHYWNFETSNNLFSKYPFQFNMLYRSPTTYTCVVLKTAFCELKTTTQEVFFPKSS